MYVGMYVHVRVNVTCFVCVLRMFSARSEAESASRDVSGKDGPDDVRRPTHACTA